jgi:nitrogen fixation/metabolism regulation signal transduction histidine kinase
MKILHQRLLIGFSVLAVVAVICSIVSVVVINNQNKASSRKKLETSLKTSLDFATAPFPNTDELRVAFVATKINERFTELRVLKFL